MLENNIKNLFWAIPILFFLGATNQVFGQTVETVGGELTSTPLQIQHFGWLAAMALTINLAYLNLSNFRFLVLTADYINNWLEKDSEVEKKLIQKSTDENGKFWVSMISSLGDFKNRQPVLYKKLNIESVPIDKNHLPLTAGFFIYIYCTSVKDKNCIIHIDRFICCLLLFISALYIFYMSYVGIPGSVRTTPIFTFSLEILGSAEFWLNFTILLTLLGMGWHMVRRGWSVTNCLYVIITLILLIIYLTSMEHGDITSSEKIVKSERFIFFILAWCCVLPYILVLISWTGWRELQRKIQDWSEKSSNSELVTRESDAKSSN